MEDGKIKQKIQQTLSMMIKRKKFTESQTYDCFLLGLFQNNTKNDA